MTENELNLTAVREGREAFEDANFVIIATPTNYDSISQHFDTFSVESVIEQVLGSGSDAFIIVKSTVPVGFTECMRTKHDTERKTLRLCLWAILRQRR